MSSNPGTTKGESNSDITVCAMNIEGTDIIQIQFGFKASPERLVKFCIEVLGPAVEKYDFEHDPHTPSRPTIVS